MIRHEIRYSHLKFFATLKNNATDDVAKGTRKKKFSPNATRETNESRSKKIFVPNSRFHM